jgi:hypothetical protein
MLRSKVSEVAIFNMLSENEFTFRIVGKDLDNQKVLTSVFAEKLSLLVDAMEAADKAVNGGKKYFDYFIADLKASSASATVKEKLCGSRTPEFSSIAAVTSCAKSISAGDFEYSLRYPVITEKLVSLSKGVDKKYHHAEIHANDNVIFIDKNFHKLALEAQKRIDDNKTKEKWFEGVVIGSFDGQLMQADFRDESTPKYIIRLTSGNIDINCTCSKDLVNDIIPVLTKRVNITGRAYYSGKSGLPESIEIIKVPEIVSTSVEFSKWKNAFSMIDNCDTWDEFN